MLFRSKICHKPPGAKRTDLDLSALVHQCVLILKYRNNTNP